MAGRPLLPIPCCFALFDVWQGLPASLLSGRTHSSDLATPGWGRAAAPGSLASFQIHMSQLQDAPLPTAGRPSSRSPQDACIPTAGLCPLRSPVSLHPTHPTLSTTSSSPAEKAGNSLGKFPSHSPAPESSSPHSSPRCRAGPSRTVPLCFSRTSL